MKKTNLRKNKGITLIALVITIIVLLILAGVAISMLSGENGILKKAAEAKTKTEEGQDVEQRNLKSTELQMYFTINNKQRYSSYGCITGVNIEEKVGNLLNDFPNDKYTIWSKDNVKLDEGENLATGMIVKDEKQNEVGNIVIYGDVNGDGSVNGLDSLCINNALQGGTGIYNCYKVAADINQDGKIDKTDNSLIEASLNTEYFINQKRYAKNQNDIKYITPEKILEEYVKILKTKFEGTKYSLEWYNEEKNIYCIKGADANTTAGELLDIIDDDKVEIRKSTKVYKREEAIEDLCTLYYNREDTTAGMSLRTVIKF